VNNLSKIYTNLTVILVSIILSSLSVSSLAVVLEHAYLVYFWYLALGGVAMMVAISFMIGVSLLLGRFIKWCRRLLSARGRSAIDVTT